MAVTVIRMQICNGPISRFIQHILSNEFSRFGAFITKWHNIKFMKVETTLHFMAKDRLRSPDSSRMNTHTHTLYTHTHTHTHTHTPLQDCVWQIMTVRQRDSGQCVFLLDTWWKGHERKGLSQDVLPQRPHHHHGNRSWRTRPAQRHSGEAQVLYCPGFPLLCHHPGNTSATRPPNIYSQATHILTHTVIHKWTVLSHTHTHTNTHTHPDPWKSYDTVLTGLFLSPFLRFSLCEDGPHTSCSLKRERGDYWRGGWGEKGKVFLGKTSEVNHLQ